MNTSKYRSDLKLLVYGVSFAFTPLDQDAFSGNLDFGSLTNPILYLTFNMAVRSDQSVDIYSEIDNFLLISADSIRKEFN